jgi:hypothetical protein
MRPLSELPERVISLETQFLQFRTEVRDEFSAVRSEIQLVRSEMRQGDEETRRFMRVLHEDVIARIAAIGESRP